MDEFDRFTKAEINENGQVIKLTYKNRHSPDYVFYVGLETGSSELWQVSQNVMHLITGTTAYDAPDDGHWRARAHEYIWGKSSNIVLGEN